jgi:hypothetical protein
VDAQERVLAQLARIVGVPDHAIDHVPAEALMVSDQGLERASRAGQHRGHEYAVGVDGFRRPGRTHVSGFDDR